MSTLLFWRKIALFCCSQLTIMKELVKILLPHLTAVLIFLLIAVIYCHPALEGKVLTQHDITHWKGSVQQSVIYSQSHDQYPLWTNSVFSGMPTFQIGYPANNIVPWTAHEIFTLGLPKPIQFFFLACICFYFLSFVLGVRTLLGVLGSLAFAYATYNPVIIAAGHDTKMLSIAYMPALLASLLLIYEKKYWLGAGLTALFSSVLICMNHPQIAYYFFIAVFIMTVFFILNWIQKREWRHLLIALSLTLIAGTIGLLSNAVSILSTYEYQKETIRGGANLINEADKENKSKTGLDKDYAFSYSMGITEPFVMLVPHLFGGSNDHLEMSEEKSKAIEVVRSMPQDAQQFLFQNFPFFFGQTESGELYARTYWGGLGATSGPPYIGAVIFFLALVGFFVIDKKHKWWILTTLFATIVMSWGGYFKQFNELLYEYLPLYNKFRAPSMILVIPQLLLPVAAILGVHKLLNVVDKSKIKKQFNKSLLTLLAVILLLIVFYFTFEFITTDTKELLKNKELLSQPQAFDLVKQFIDGLKEDRRALMLQDILRSIGFISIAVFLLFLFIHNKIKSNVVIVGLILIAFVDVMSVNNLYLNKNSFKDEIENNQNFNTTAADNEILADTSFYRVYNISGDQFSENITSYNYNSVGGYHAAKLSLYMDLIEHQISKGNEKVLDMLNTKYLIRKDQKGLTEAYQRRTTALGNCWLVKNIKFVKDAKLEMNALNNFTPKDTAIVQESFKSFIPFEIKADTAASIQLLKNENDYIKYQFNSIGNQFAVFSEIFYKSGWKAFANGKEIPIVKTNYALRGLSLPAGNYNIEFRFEPLGYFKGKKMTTIFSVLLLLLLSIGLFFELKKYRHGV